MPDRDQFSNALRLGRTAATAMRTALEGGTDCDVEVCEVLNQTIAHAGGLPQLEKLLGLMDDPSNPSLFPRALDEFEGLLSQYRRNGLDLRFERSVIGAVAAGTTDGEAILTKAMTDIVLWRVVDSRGGLVSQLGPLAVDQERERILGIITPLASQAAAKLLDAPHLQRLGLKPTVTPTINLWGDLGKGV